MCAVTVGCISIKHGVSAISTTISDPGTQLTKDCLLEHAYKLNERLEVSELH
jgi:hypothetical protein